MTEIIYRHGTAEIRVGQYVCRLFAMERTGEMLRIKLEEDLKPIADKIAEALKE